MKRKMRFFNDLELRQERSVLASSPTFKSNNILEGQKMKRIFSQILF